MTKEEKKDIFYRYLTYFLVFSFFGWAFETFAVFLETGKWTARGYFFIGPRLSQAFTTHNFSLLTSPNIWGLPAIEMYGIGGLLIVTLLKRYKDSILKIFVYGAIAMTVFELLGSYWCENILHHSYWDYSKDFLNFQGRICLRSSIAWGILSIFVIKVCEPLLEKYYLRIKKKKHYRIVLIVLGLLMIYCALVKYIFYTNIIAN